MTSPRITERRRLALEQLEDRSVPSTVAAFDPQTAIWYLRGANSAGSASAGQFQYGGVGWEAVTGDWSGNGTTTVGVVDPTNASGLVWYLRNSNSAGAPDVTPFVFGLPGWIPVTGDWTGSGHTGIGVYDPSTGTWYLRNSASAGAADTVFQYGGAGWLPVTGDWDGNGTTTVGVVDPTNASGLVWYLRNSNSAGAPDVTPFVYGLQNWTPVVGDWNNDGTTTVGAVDSSATWYLRNSNSAGTPDVTPFSFGLGSWTPVVTATSRASATSSLLTPAVTQGPYFEEFSDAALQRSDLTSGTTRSSVVNGVPLSVTFNVYQVKGSSVTPLSGARVDVWHADALGVYSDESSEGTSGQTWLRGYQFTDKNGQVTFDTILPGWYPGRTPHIHFMVRTVASNGSVLSDLLTSQLFFDPTSIAYLYANNAPYNTRPTPDTSNTSDMVYNTAASDGSIAGPRLILSLYKASSGNGYTATFNVYVPAS
jgi:protocatechuate 3,4-dioxygenase beta subunit